MRSATRSSSWRRAALVAAALCATALGAPYPTLEAGGVTDIAGVLTPEQHEHLERTLATVESRSGTQIAVVILRTLHEYPGTRNESIESFSRGLFDTYGLGNRSTNDGVLLVVAVNDRKARIELGAGFGQERNEEAQAIVGGVIVPAFKEGDYAGGIVAGVDAMAQRWGGVTLGFPWRIFLVFAGSIAAALIGISLVVSGKRGWGWVVVGLTLVVVIGLIWMAILILKFLPRRRSRWSLLGDSGWSGGGGGFGGGFSGGGGATGSW